MRFISENKTILFDLEETLIHISLEIKGADLIIPIKKKDGVSGTVGIWSYLDRGVL